MEEILRKLQKDASGHKHKAIRDACVHACGESTAASRLSGCRWGGGGGGGGKGMGAICDCVHLLAFREQRAATLIPQACVSNSGREILQRHLKENQCFSQVDHLFEVVNPKE